MRVLEALLLVACCSGQGLFNGPKPSLHEALEFMNSIVDDVSIALNDTNFEHETQAATGATTGDWFVYFYSPTCMRCQFMSPEWKFFAERMKEQEIPINVARVDITANEKLAMRFKIYSTPTFLYFKGGYYYNFTDYANSDTLDAMVKAEKYLEYEKKPVPPEISALMDWYMYLRWWAIKIWKYEKNCALACIGGTVGVVVLLRLALKKLRKTPEPAPQPKKKKD